MKNKRFKTIFLLVFVILLTLFLFTQITFNKFLNLRWSCRDIIEYEGGGISEPCFLYKGVWSPILNIKHVFSMRSTL